MILIDLFNTHKNLVSPKCYMYLIYRNVWHIKFPTQDSWGPDTLKLKVFVHIIDLLTYLQESVTHWGPTNMIEWINTHTYWSVGHIEVPTHEWFINTHTYWSVGYIEVPTHDDWLLGVQLFQIISKITVPLFCPVLQTNQTFTRIWQIWNWSSFFETVFCIPLCLTCTTF